MFRFRTVAAVTLAASTVVACSDDITSPSLSAPQSPNLSVQSSREAVVAGEVIVRTVDGVNPADVGRAHGLALGEIGYHGAFAVLRGAAGAEYANARALAADSRVVYAEPNYLRQTTTIDPRLWAFYNPGGLNMKYTRGGSSGSFISSSYASTADADEDNVEGYAAGGSAVVVGSIDTGVDFTHPEFKNADGTSRLIAGRDWYSNDNDPSDTEDHGSHTTGTMAGNTVGIAGVSGAAPNVKVYVQRVCGKRGCPTAAIVSAIRAAADYPGMVAMNLSLGGTSISQAETDAIAYAVGKNVLVIASAGNDGTTTVSCPACDVNAISVAATQWQDKLASYSNSGSGLDISAPGGNCYSNTTPEGCIYSAIRGGYGWMQGTSMAAPQVTGTAAIVASKTGLRGQALRDRILSTADDLGSSGYDTTFGAGRLNSYRAVTGTSLPAGQ
ncbi:MAG TPA: S8 family serine peptidase [Gemmatimonadaceae bacterium]|jgi:subtilisin family serine protease|nr:S8 family serine peptidase [Gemmatimonadaceae bacterium]